MTFARLFLVFALFAVGIQEIYGHGKMTDPINRSSVWQLQQWDDTPINYEDNENFCGGFSVQHNVNGGKCGPFGDDYRDPVPRKNENGGYYGKGHVVKSYEAGSTVKVKVDLSTNHKGYFRFSICRLSSAKAIETEECFAEHPLKLINSKGETSDRFDVADLHGEIGIQVMLPKDLECQRCVMRWDYTCGNNWGFCNVKTGEGRNGCGAQEKFRSCSDIAIQ